MNEKEHILLLTVARILRAVRKESHDHYSAEDVAALNSALVPFDPVKVKIEDDGCNEQQAPR